MARGKRNIGATLTLKDGNFTAGIRKAITGTNQFKTHTVNATGSLRKMGKQSDATGQSLASFAKKVTGVVAAYVSLNKIKDALEFGDALVQTDARLNLMNDGLQTTAELNEKIFESALRARGGYMETAQAISKMGLLAGDAFKSNDEIIRFSELVNKTFKVGGSSTEEQKAATHQLTQAMASGKLQGDEFRSIMENAPMLADAISKQMKIPKGQLKEFSRDGLITADVIKNAMFSASDDINEKFSSIPITFGDRMEMLKNNGIKKIKPLMTYINNTVLPAIESRVTKGFNTIKPYIEALKPILKGVWDFGVSAFNNIRSSVERNMPKFAALKEVLIDVKDKLYNAFEHVKPTINWLKDTGIPLLIDIIAGVIQKSTELYNYINDNWSRIGPIVNGIVGSIVSYKIALIATNSWTKIVAVTTGLWTAAVNLWTAAKTGALGIEIAWSIMRAKELLHTAIMIVKYPLLTALMLKDAAVRGIQVVANSAFCTSIWATVTALWAQTAAFLASPVGWVVIGIGLLIGAFVLLWKKCDPFREFWINMWNKIVEGVKKAVDKIKELWDKLKEFLKNPIKGVVKLFKKTDEDGTDDPQVDGSHAGGLSRVPFDGYIARLHKNERVLTAGENKQYTEQRKSINFGNIYITAKGITADEVVDEVVPKLKLAIENL